MPIVTGILSHANCSECIMKALKERCICPTCKVPVLVKGLHKNLTINSLVACVGKLGELLQRVASSGPPPTPSSSSLPGCLDEADEDMTELEETDYGPNDEVHSSLGPEGDLAKENSRRVSVKFETGENIQPKRPKKRKTTPKSHRSMDSIRSVNGANVTEPKKNTLTPRSRKSLEPLQLHDAGENGIEERTRVVKSTPNSRKFVESVGPVEETLEPSADVATPGPKGNKGVGIRKTPEPKAASRRASLKTPGKAMATPPRVGDGKPIKILLSGIDSVLSDAIHAKVGQLNKACGGKPAQIVTEYGPSVNRIVVGTDGDGFCVRSSKYLRGVMDKKFIVNMSWILDATDEWLDPMEYLVKGDSAIGEETRAVERSIQAETSLFEGFLFHLVGEWDAATRETLLACLKGGGASKVLQTRPKACLTDPKHIIICNPDRLDEVTIEMLASQANKTTKSWVFNCISRWEIMPLDWEPPSRRASGQHTQ